MKKPRFHRRGFTLLEIVVSAGISAFVIAAVFALAAQEVRLMGATSDRMDTFQAGRAALDTMADDLRHAGGGVGYRDGDTFAGLHLGSFTAGGATFNSNNPVSDDIGVRMAIGGQATITSFGNGTAEICAGNGIKADDLVVLRSPDGIYSRSVVVNAIGGAGCTAGNCASGCEQLTWSDNNTFVSNSAATDFDYSTGELSAELRDVVWFVHEGTLRRAAFDHRQTCAARDETCGVLMAENVESVQTQVWQWDTDINDWVNVTAGPLTGAGRLRVDVELVVRARVEDDREHDPITLRLEPNTCVPDCNQRDRIQREVFRTSIEIKNSGRMITR